MEKIIEKISIVQSKKIIYNYTNSKPIKNEEINKFIKKFEDFFLTKIDEDYINFLKVSDGLEYNGYRIYCSFDYTTNDIEQSVFQNNELWYDEYDKDREFVFFAHSGLDLFVFNKIEKKYQLLDRSSSDVYKEFDSFSNMLLFILMLMLNEELD